MLSSHTVGFHWPDNSNLANLILVGLGSVGNYRNIYALLIVSINLNICEISNYNCINSVKRT